MAEIRLTEKAANIFKHLIVEEDEGTISDTYLLVGAKSGGCSGYKFFLDTTHDIRDHDITVDTDHGVKVVCKKDELEDIIGDVLIDYNDDNLVSQGFEFKRTKYNVTCGCGESFAPISDMERGKNQLGWDK
jgi:iron-sulfur cluster assembly accessory protein